MATAKPSGRRRPRQSNLQRYWPLLVTAAVIIAAIAGFAYLAAHQATPTAAPTTTSKVITQLTKPNPSVASAVGTGGLPNPLKVAGGAAPLKDPAGKPLVVYVGAEYCPFCAAERWSLIHALARFGTFEGLALSTSSSTDAYPDTPTFTFRAATYQSATIAFSAVETSDRQQNPLQTPNASQRAALDAFDAAGSIPFLDLGNRYYQVGAGYHPDVLTGLSWEQITAQLNDPNSAVAQSVIGDANYLTAAICRMTGDQPATTCADPAISKIAAGLG
jgi:hypothetical protein